MGFDVLYIIYSLHPSSPLGHGRVTHFSEGLYRMAVGQIRILGVTISHFSTSNFLVACVCYLYPCFSWYILPPNILFCGAKKVFCILQLGAGKSSNFLEASCIVAHVLSLLRGGGGWGGVRPISSIEPSKTNHVNSRTVEGKIICFMCVC